MNNRFRNFIDSANASKASFDDSIEGIRSTLDTMTAQSASVAVPTAAKTGWLRGSLSYPWVLVCSLVPSIKELF